MILYSHINSKSHLKMQWRRLLSTLSHTYNKELSNKRAAETSNIIKCPYQENYKTHHDLAIEHQCPSLIIFTNQPQKPP